MAICKPGYQPFAFFDENGMVKGHDVVMLNMLYEKVVDPCLALHCMCTIRGGVARSALIFSESRKTAGLKL